MFNPSHDRTNPAKLDVQDAFFPKQDESVPMRAGPHGLALLILMFPRRIETLCAQEYFALVGLDLREASFATSIRQILAPSKYFRCNYEMSNVILTRTNLASRSRQ
jgi:hypothetical protein